MKIYTLEELQELRMPFGKHKDLPLDEVPLSYLDWLSGQDLREPFRSQVDQYLNNPTIKRMAEEEGL